ncbi:MAG: carbohydrate-binding protein [Oscillospiraceae bacterium]|nr:carbohydrate-binding protein [Oscillospiraceae bacterium]
MFKKSIALFMALAVLFVLLPSPVEVSAATADGNPELSRAIGPEGMVLLKNEGQSLPLAAGARVTLFGQSRNYIKGGTGSGDVNVAYTRNIFYGMNLKSQEGKIVLNQTTYPTGGNSYSVTAANVTAARAVSDVAVVVITRNSGEGGDRSASAGDYYLSTNETSMLNFISAGFDNIIVVMNIGGIVDMTWVRDYPNIKAVLLAWQAGMEGGNAVADVLVGDKYPSGKLSDTFAENYNYYPSSTASGIGTFGGNGDVFYAEDIYVGYRYFATADPSYSKVTYEFGYGLSYANLALTPTFYGTAPGFGQVPVNDGKITVSASVANIGDKFSGKEVVQVYYQGPDGELNKPARELVTYKKTSELEPGRSQALDLSFSISNMASYDDRGDTGNKSCWVLEPGRYNIYVGNSVKNAVLVGYHEVSELTVTEECHEYLTSPSGYDYLVNPVTGETKRNGPPPPIPEYTLVADKVTNINAYEPSYKSAGIVYVTGSSAGNPSVTGFTTGAWLRYNVKIEQAGDYIFSVNYANGNAAIANSFSVYLDEEAEPLNKSLISMVQTSTSSMYQPLDSAEYTISLPAGEHVITLIANASPNGYLNFLTFRPSWVERGVYTILPANQTKITVSDYYDAILTGSTTFELIPDGSGERCLGSFTSGSKITYKVNVEYGGEYEVIIDYANGNAAMDDQIRLFFDDNCPAETRLATNPSTIAIAQTATSGALRYYTFVDSAAYRVTLTEGTHYFTIAVTGSTTSAGNLRSIKIRPAANYILNDRTTLINAFDYTTATANIRLEDVPATGVPTVAFFNNGEVLTYALNVQTAGAYKFQLNYSNGRAAINDPFTLSVNDIAQPVQIRMEQTGNGDGDGQWYNPRLSSVYLINLPAGAVTLKFSAKTSVGNLNYFTLRPDWLPDGYYNVSPTSATRVMAFPPTSYTFTGSAAFENVPGTQDSCIGNFDTGTRLNYTLNVSAAGTYELVFDYANGNADRTNAIDVLVNNNNTGLVVNFPRIVPSGWYDFGNSAVYEVSLPAGEVAFSLVSKTTSAANIRSMYLTPKTVVMGYVYDPSQYVPKYDIDPKNSIFAPELFDGPKLMDIVDENGHISEEDLDAFVNLMTVEEMGYLSSGHGAGIPSGTGTLGGLARLGMPALETADGPAGLRIDSATAWPIGTMLACTWNEELLEQMGRAVGDEMVLNHVDIWLAPGMNIHRNPLCGRNFEYYSEDPLITGKSAAAITRGVQSRNVGVTLKHYAFNNQEQARNDAGNSVLTERAAREIYLKGFEIAVKEGNPFCIMSSYNFVNGVETSERWDLQTGITYGEWGWRGIIMTDWGNNSNIVREALAGNDIKMSSGSSSSIVTAVNNGTLPISQLRENMKDIVITTARSKKLFQELEIQVTPIRAVGRIRIEAEDFNEAGAATDGQVPQNEGTSDTGGGRNLGYMNTGGSVTYYVDVARTGIYNITFRYAGNNGNGGRLEVFEDNVSTGRIAQLTNTGDWQNWATLAPIQVPLTAGEHRLRIYIANGGCNLNWFDIERVLTPDISIDPGFQIYQSAVEVESGKYSPEFAIIRSASAGAAPATLYAAVYDAAGRLLDVDVTPIDATTTSYTMAVATLNKHAAGVSYKFFIWDGEFRPLTALNVLS